MLVSVKKFEKRCCEPIIMMLFPLWLAYLCMCNRILNNELWEEVSKCHPEKFLSDCRNFKVKESYSFLSMFSCMRGCANLGLLQNLANMIPAGLGKNQPLRHNKAESSNGPGFLMTSLSCQVTLVFSYLWTSWCDIIVCN